MNALLAVIRHDLKLAFRRPAELLQPLWFMALVVALFPLGVGTDSAQLQSIAPGVIWVAALLASIIGLEGLFRHDFEHGSLEQWLCNEHSLSALVLGRVFAHWLIAGVPVIVFSPLLGIWMQLPWPSIRILILTLILGTPTLSLLGSLGAALSLGARRGGLLLALLIAPLYVPALIFATDAVSASLTDDPQQMQLLLLLAMLILALTFIPFAIAAALRIHLQE